VQCNVGQATNIKMGFVNNYFKAVMRVSIASGAMVE
jgi:hypothetical protein